MNPLVDRYVRHVTQNLPERDRAEIDKELRSQIQDRLDDQFGGAPAQADVAAVLAEMGEPRKLAASYGSPQSLVGPELYPYLREVLRHGWLIVPPLIMLANGISALTGDAPRNWVAVAFQSGLQALWTGVAFTGIVVLIFVLLEREGVRASRAAKPFDPLALSDIGPATQVDRAELGVGIAIGLFMLLVFGYFLSVGGLTWRFSLSDPGPVLPVPAAGLIVLIVSNLGTLVLNFVTLLRNRWTFLAYLADAVFELVSIAGLYVAILKPLSAVISAGVPLFRNAAWADQTPGLFACIAVAISLLAHARKLFQLWRNRRQEQSA